MLIALRTQAAWRPFSVSFHELIQHPTKYNGKGVSIRAYVVTSYTHCGEF
jgi:hypothetical protein